MKREHLIPTPIVDKNGKATVTYTKPNAPTDKASGSIPAPVTTSAYPPIAKLANRVVESLRLNKLRQYDAVRETLTTYPESFIKELLTVDTEDVLWDKLCKLITDKEPASVVGEAKCFYPHFNTDYAADARAYIRSLHHYPQLPRMSDYSTADQQTREQCIALLTVTQMMDDDGFMNEHTVRLPILYRKDTERQDVTIIDSPEIIALVLERPEKATAIGEVIIARRTRDAELIKDMLDHENSALAEGIL